MRRRQFLGLLAAGVPAAAQLPAGRPPVPRVNGGINIQPLRRLSGAPSSAQPLIDPDLVALQLRAVYALGFEQLRVTLSFNRFGPDFLAAIPYCRAARALGIDVLGVMSDFTGYSLAQAILNERSRAAVLNTYRDIFVLPSVEPATPAVARAGDFSLQVLNEPTHALGLAPDDYVRDLLRPVNANFKLRNPDILIVSAAEVGNVEGVYRMRAMFEAGLEAHCDRVAYHVYSSRLPPLLSGLARRPVWITESGAAPTAQHLPWVRDVFPSLRRDIAGVERIFFYVLYDTGPGRFRLFDVARDASGVARLRVESQELVDHFAARVAAASGAAPSATFEELIPDVTKYFPTQFDLDRVVEATPFIPPP